MAKWTDDPTVGPYRDALRPDANCPWFGHPHRRHIYYRYYLHGTATLTCSGWTRVEIAAERRNMTAIRRIDRRAARRRSRG